MNHHDVLCIIDILWAATFAIAVILSAKKWAKVSTPLEERMKSLKEGSDESDIHRLAPRS